MVKLLHEVHGRGPEVDQEEAPEGEQHEVKARSADALSREYQTANRNVEEARRKKVKCERRISDLEEELRELRSAMTTHVDVLAKAEEVSNVVFAELKHARAAGGQVSPNLLEEGTDAEMDTSGGDPVEEVRAGIHAGPEHYTVTEDDRAAYDRYVASEKEAGREEMVMSAEVFGWKRYVDIAMARIAAKPRRGATRRGRRRTRSNDTESGDSRRSRSDRQRHRARGDVC